MFFSATAAGVRVTCTVTAKQLEVTLVTVGPGLARAESDSDSDTSKGQRTTEPNLTHSEEMFVNGGATAASAGARGYRTPADSKERLFARAIMAPPPHQKMRLSLLTS